MADLFCPEPADLDRLRREGKSTVTFGPLPQDEKGRPLPEWVRGTCPECGDDLVSNLYLVRHGFICRWECWNSLKEDATCTYSKTL